MSEGPHTAISEHSTALIAYRFGEAIVRFRYFVEVNYVSAASLLDLGDDRPPQVPDIIDACLGVIVEHGTLLAREMSSAPNVVACANAMSLEAQRMRNHIELAWMNADHIARLERRRDDSESSDRRYESQLDAQVLQGFSGGNGDTFLESPLGTSAWRNYLDSANGLAISLPSLYRCLFDLSRLVAAVVFPSPADFDAERGHIRAFSTAYIQGQISPEITRLMKAILSESNLLEGLPMRLNGRDPDREAERLHKSIIARLLNRLRSAGSHNETVGRGQVSTIKLGSGSVATSLTVTPLGPNEDINALLAMKEKMDSKNEYIGLSLPVLRLFREVDILNQLPNDPVVILGPSGSGKTCLARLMHLASDRKCGNFRDLSADDISDGDATLRRTKWAGYGRNSGLSGTTKHQTSKGY